MDCAYLCMEKVSESSRLINHWTDVHATSEMSHYVLTNDLSVSDSPCFMHKMLTCKDKVSQIWPWKNNDEKE
jgi:hypothetical protein